MQQWHMVTLVGRDRPGIVAAVSDALYQRGANLGEASMTRLGENFTMMLMVTFPDSIESLRSCLAPVADRLGLRVHVDAVEGRLHRHVQPDVRVRVFGADRAGIVAQVASALGDAGLNITSLETDVGGSEAKPFYVMSLEGTAGQGLEPLRLALNRMRDAGVDASLEPIDTLVG